MIQYLRYSSSIFFLYDIINYLGFIALFLFCFVQINESKNHSIYLTFLLERVRKTVHAGLVFSIVEALILSLFIKAFPSLTIARPFARLFYDFTGGKGAVLYFGDLFSSFPFFLIGAFLLGMKPSKTLDLLVPGFPLALLYAKLACFCSGCCNGISISKGFFYNYRTHLLEFPVQLVESMEAFVIFFILMKIRKKAKLGTMFPLYLVFYSGMRFFSEFFRVQPDILGPLKCAQIFCIVGIVLGFVGFILAEKYAEQIDNAFGRIYSKIEKCLCKKIPKKVV